METTGQIDQPDAPNRRRRTVAAGAAALMTLAMAAIAVGGLPATDADARAVVSGATVIGSAAGLGAAWAIITGRIRTGGLLLVLSIVTPTFAAAALNLVPLLLGVVLVVDSFRSDGLFVAHRSPRRRSSAAAANA